MKTPHCSREDEVLEALRSGRFSGPWGEDLRRHAAACPLCSEVVLVSEMLACNDRLEDAEPRLPSAGLVWWKAQLSARRLAAERAAQPITLIERVARACGALCALGLILAYWPRIVRWMTGARTVVRDRSGPDWVGRLVQCFGGGSSSYLLVASAGAFIILMMFAAYVVLREE